MSGRIDKVRQLSALNNKSAELIDTLKHILTNEHENEDAYYEVTMSSLKKIILTMQNTIEEK